MEQSIPWMDCFQDHGFLAVNGTIHPMDGLLPGSWIPCSKWNNPSHGWIYYEDHGFLAVNGIIRPMDGLLPGSWILRSVSAVVSICRYDELSSSCICYLHLCVICTEGIWMDAKKCRALVSGVVVWYSGYVYLFFFCSNLRIPMLHPMMMRRRRIRMAQSHLCV
jgi:hypothetical protein